MTLWLQHLLVLVLVATCVAVVGRQLIGTFRISRGKKLGSCCVTGCDTSQAPSSPAAGDRIVFIPSSSLKLRK